jgi:YwiC-like protein
MTDMAQDVRAGGVRPRSLLLPREHGAYAELGFTLATGLALGDFTSAKIFFAASLVLFFIVHEPLLILLGERGRRRLDQFKERAFFTAAGLTATAVVLGVLGLWQAPAAARAAVLLPVVFGASLGVMIVTGREKSAVGQNLVALTFAGAVVALALAGDASLPISLTAGALWAVIFTLQTFAVREVRGRLRKPVEPLAVSAVLWMSAAAALIGLFLVVRGWLPFVAFLGLLPTVMTAAACGLLGVSPRRLRVVGWSFVSSSLLALAAILMAFR